MTTTKYSIPCTASLNVTVPYDPNVPLDTNAEGWVLLANAAFFAFVSAYATTTTTAFAYLQRRTQRHDPRLAARPLGLIVATAIGCWLASVIVCLREVVGRKHWPCAAFPWVWALMVGFGLGGPTILLVTTLSRHVFHRLRWLSGGRVLAKLRRGLGPQTPLLSAAPRRLAASQPSQNSQRMGTAAEPPDGAPPARHASSSAQLGNVAMFLLRDLPRTFVLGPTTLLARARLVRRHPAQPHTTTTGNGCLLYTSPSPRD